MKVRFVKSGYHWNYEDLRSDLRIYRIENPAFKSFHVSVYGSGDYHAKDKRSNYVGYVNKRWINKGISRLAKMLHLFEQHILHTLDVTLIERIKKVKQRNAKRRKKKSLKTKMNVMTSRKSETFRCKRPSIPNKPGPSSFKNFKTTLKNRVRITEWVEIVQEKEIVN